MHRKISSKNTRVCTRVYPTGPVGIKKLSRMPDTWPNLTILWPVVGVDFQRFTTFLQKIAKKACNVSKNSVKSA